MSSSSPPVPGQDHIDWSSPAVQSVVETLSTSYPGGIAGYVKKAQQLLHPSAVADSSSQEKRNLKLPAHRADVPFFETTSSSSSSSSNGQKLLENLELGNKLAGSATAFVLVAGGLGERLGAKSLKLSLPVQIAGAFARSGSILNSSGAFRDEGCFLHHYIAWLLHCSSVHAGAAASPPPLILMTSDDTHTRTLELLRANSFFGMPEGNVHLLRQTGVPCVSDSSGKLAVAGDSSSGSGGGAASLAMKPHGHGDVHRLLLSSGLLTGKLRERGCRYIVFMQDTNSGATATLPQSLAVMEEKKWSMGFTCVPRIPGEAIGALVEADRQKSSSSSSSSSSLGPRVTYCVEYNVLDEMLKREGFPNGDAPASATDPFSAFPGTINTLLLRLDAYTETVARTEGVIAEFINPKYADSTKTAFKSPARLETLMQDIALELDASAAGPVGAVVFDRRTYFPVKNAIQDGVAKWASLGIDPHNASQGEAGCFLLKRMAVAPFVNQECVKSWPLERCVAASPSLPAAAAGAATTAAATLLAPDVSVLGRLPVAVFPIIQTPTPLDALSAAKIFKGRDAVKISRRSSLVVVPASAAAPCCDVVFESLDLDGALVVEIPNNADRSVVLVFDFSAAIKNRGWKLVPVDPADGGDASEAEKLRGFRYESEETLVVRVPASAVANGGKVVKVTLKNGEPEFSVTSQL